MQHPTGISCSAGTMLACSTCSHIKGREEIYQIKIALLRIYGMVFTISKAEMPGHITYRKDHARPYLKVMRAVHRHHCCLCRCAIRHLTSVVRCRPSLRRILVVLAGLVQRIHLDTHPGHGALKTPEAIVGHGVQRIHGTAKLRVVGSVCCGHA